jgi:hypothetical protein
MQASNKSKLGHLADALRSHKQTPAPPSPKPPAVDKSAWEKSVEQKKLKHLTVHDLGLIVFNETQSFTDSKDSNEPIGAGREKLAHAVINGNATWGADRQKHAHAALPIEPSSDALRNPKTQAAYDSSMKAAREAYLSGTDPTNGAVHAIQPPRPDRSNYVFSGGKPEGVKLSTQSGPYSNA